MLANKILPIMMGISAWLGGGYSLHDKAYANDYQKIHSHKEAMTIRRNRRKNKQAARSRRINKLRSM